MGTLAPTAVVGTEPQRPTMSGGSINYLYLMAPDVCVAFAFG
jgi:hypothetical protein